MDNLKLKTMKTFALVGRNISYSFSRKYFAEKFAKEKGGRVVSFDEMPDSYIFK